MEVIQMRELNTIHQLLSVLGYGKSAAQTAEQLFTQFSNESLSDFKRKLRELAQEARLAGHWIIGDTKVITLPFPNPNGRSTEIGEWQPSAQN